METGSSLNQCIKLICDMNSLRLVKAILLKYGE